MPIDYFAGINRKGKNNEDQQLSSESSERSRKNNTEWLPSEPKFQIDDLILDKPTREQLLDVVSFYECRDKILYEWGFKDRYEERMNLTVNLYGDSGTGKTMAAHAIAFELGKRILFVDYAEIESKYVGETAKNLKKLFEDAEKLDAVIIFDEADALLSRRVTDMRSSTDVSVNQTRSVLLNLLNDYQGIVIFTTNFIRNFDPAFIRRIRYQIHFELPNQLLRKKLWEMYVPNELPTNLDYDMISTRYEGISGSDIANAVLSAAIKAARNKAEVVDMSCFTEAIENIIRAKKANSVNSETVTHRVVSDEYVKEQLQIKGDVS